MRINDLWRKLWKPAKRTPIRNAKQRGNTLNCEKLEDRVVPAYYSAGGVTIQNEQFNVAPDIDLRNAGYNSTINYIALHLYDLSHTYPDDLDVVFGVVFVNRMQPMSDAGAGFDINNVNLIFVPDGWSTNTLPDNGQIVSGTYRGSAYGIGGDQEGWNPHLETLYGMSPNQIWGLEMRDDAAGDTGSLGGWGLEFYTAPYNVYPIAPHLLGTGYTIYEKGSVLLTATASDDDSHNLDFYWDLNNDGSFNDLVSDPHSVTLTWDRLKTYNPTLYDNFTIRVQVWDPFSTVNSPTTRITAIDDDQLAPVIQVSRTSGGSAIPNGKSGQELSSVDQRFYWRIQDPKISGTPTANANGVDTSVTIRKGTEVIFTQTYSATGDTIISDSFDFNAFGVGQYTLDITATDKDNDRPNDSLSSSFSYILNVLNSPPSAAFTVTPGPEGSPTVFDASASLDVDGDAITEYVWNLGDGTLARGKIIEHTYRDNGNYNVTLTAVPATGGSDVGTTTSKVVIPNVAPTLKASAASSVSEMQPLALNLSIFDPGADKATILVDWGDGNKGTFALGDPVRHTYTRGGQQHTVRVSLEDEDGTYADLFVHTVDVEDAPPVVSGLLPSYTARPNVAIDFAVSVLDGEDDHLIFGWDFGDGTILSGTNLQSVSHKYTADGTYTVTLMVGDSDDLFTTVTTQVSIGIPVSFTSTGKSISENGGFIQITAKLDDAIPLPYNVTVPLTVTGVSSADYTLPQPFIVIVAGQLSGSTKLSIIDDNLSEDDEELIVTMGLPNGASRGPISEYRVLIEDNDIPPSVFFLPPGRTVEESVGTIPLTASLTKVSGRDVIIPLAFTGTATMGVDYLAPTQIVIPAGQLTGTANITVLDDAMAESAESIVVQMLASGQALASTGAGQPTTVSFIVSPSDVPSVSLDSAYRLTAEGVGEIFIRVRPSYFSDQVIRVPFTVSGNAPRIATPDIDFVILEDELVILPGADQAWLTVQITDDVLVEGTENFVITLGQPTNATLGVSQWVLTDILDNDRVRVSFEPGDIEVFEDHDEIAVRVVLSNPSQYESTTVTILVSGTATDGADYTISTKEVTFAPLETEQWITLSLQDDPANEPTESIFLSLGTITMSEGGDAVVGEVPTKLIRVRDNDPYVNLPSIGRIVNEGDGTITMQVSLSAATNQAVTVPISYSGTARRGEDFTGPDSVTISAGSVSANFTITIIDDPRIEFEEIINVAIRTPSNALLGQSTDSIRIRDNDRAVVTWTSTRYSTQEEDGSVILSVELSQPNLTDTTIRVSYTPVDADPETDYQVLTSTIFIPQGQTSGTITVQSIDDPFKEAPESFRVTMVSTIGADLPNNSDARSATVTITDLDQFTYAELMAPRRVPNERGQPYQPNDLFDALLYVFGDIPPDQIPETRNALASMIFDNADSGVVWALEKLVEVDAALPFDILFGYFKDRYPTNPKGWIDWVAFHDHRRNDPSGFHREFAFHIGRTTLKYVAKSALDAYVPGLGTVVFFVGEKLVDKYELDKHWEAGVKNVSNVLSGKKKIGGIKFKLGPADGSLVFFDMNFDGIRSGNEPYATTTPDGGALLIGMEVADLNDDGLLDNTEGQWIAMGGIDTSVNLPFRMAFTAPASFAIISGASTLVAKLLEIEAFPQTPEGVVAAEQRVSEAFGLSGRMWSGWDFVQEAIDGNHDAAAIFGKETQFYNTVVMISSFFEGRASGLPFAFLANVAVGDIAAKISQPNSFLNLGRETVIANIIRGVSVRTGIAVTDAEINLLAHAIGEANRLIDSLPVEGSLTYLETVVKVHRVAQGEFSAILTRFGTGELTAVDFAEEAARLADAVAQAQSFAIAPVYLATFSSSVVESNSGETFIEFTVAPLIKPVMPVSVNYATADGTARSGEDYIAASGTLTWEAGDDSPRIILIRVLGDTLVESDETINFTLSNAVNATIFTPITQDFIRNDDLAVFTSAAEQQDVFTVTVNSSTLIIERNGVETFRESLVEGGEVTLAGRFDDSVSVFTRGDAVSQSIGLDGVRTLNVGRHTIRVTGISNIQGEQVTDIVGVPRYLFAERTMTVHAEVPVAFDPATTTYRWELIAAGASTTVQNGNESTFDFALPAEGDYELRLTMSDGVQSTTVRKELSVLPVNVPPIAAPDSATTGENTSVTNNVIANDTDLDDTQTLSLVPGSAVVQSMIRNRDGGSISPVSSRVSQSGNAITFDPGSDFNFLAQGETATVTISYTVTDDFTTPLTADGTLTVTILGLNDAPTVSVTQPTVAVNEGQVASNTGSVADLDLTDVVSLTASIGTVTMLPGGRWQWTMPAPDDLAATTVTITATDSRGSRGSGSFQLTVANVAPTVAITGVPPAAQEGSPITLRGTVSDPGRDTHTYQWQVTRDGATYAAGTESGFTFTPDDDGTYTVTLTVTDDNGGKSSDSVRIVVANVAPTVAIVDAVATSREGMPITLGSRVIDPGIRDIHAYNWRVERDGVLFAEGFESDLTFTPDRPGSYVVTLSVADGPDSPPASVVSDSWTIRVTAVDQNTQPLFAVTGPTGETIILDRDGTVISTTPGLGGSGGSGAVGDVTGDGNPDIIQGSGDGIRGIVAVLDSKTGAMIWSAPVFESTYSRGVFVASADLNADGHADIAVSAFDGGGGRVTLFDGKTGAVLADFFGIEDPNFRGGARIAFGDVNGDGRTDLIVAAGAGGGPRIAVFDGKSLQSGMPVKLLDDFFVFEPTLRYGAFATAGDTNGDGLADLIFGAGPGGAPRVMVWDAASLLEGGPEGAVTLANFFADTPILTTGARVSAKELDGDGFADIVVGVSDDSNSVVKAFLGSELIPSGTPPVGLELDLLGNQIYVG